MNIFGDTLKTILQSERAIVVTAALVGAGALLVWGEQNSFFNLSALPKWARPTGEIIWAVAVCHVAVRLLVFLWSSLRAAARSIQNMPRKLRQLKADSHIIQRLCATTGLPREVICYARYKRKNHIWISSENEPKWREQLLRIGLIEQSDAQFRVAYYKIHPVAWKYIENHPNQFVHKLQWVRAPWETSLNEAKIEAELRDI